MPARNRHRDAVRPRKAARFSGAVFPSGDRYRQLRTRCPRGNDISRGVTAALCRRVTQFIKRVSTVKNSVCHTCARPNGIMKNSPECVGVSTVSPSAVWEEFVKPVILSLKRAIVAVILGTGSRCARQGRSQMARHRVRRSGSHLVCPLAGRRFPTGNPDRATSLRGLRYVGVQDYYYASEPRTIDEPVARLVSHTDTSRAIPSHPVGLARGK